jgi:hypothetical protein
LRTSAWGARLDVLLLLLPLFFFLFLFLFLRIFKEMKRGRMLLEFVVQSRPNFLGIVEQPEPIFEPAADIMSDGDRLKNQIILNPVIIKMGRRRRRLKRKMGMVGGHAPPGGGVGLEETFDPALSQSFERIAPFDDALEELLQARDDGAILTRQEAGEDR